eukprot:879550-Prorocentrum_minimum.AAC.2
MIRSRSRPTLPPPRVAFINCVEITRRGGDGITGSFEDVVYGRVALNADYAKRSAFVKIENSVNMRIVATGLFRGCATVSPAERGGSEKKPVTCVGEYWKEIFGHTGDRFCFGSSAAGTFVAYPLKTPGSVLHEET